MNITTNLMDFFKLPIKIIGALAIASGIILFLPNEVIDKMYMMSFREKYGFSIGILFIVTTSILLVSFIILVHKHFSKKYYKKKFEDSAPKRLKELSQYQKVIIYDLYKNNSYTDELPIGDGAVRTLEHGCFIVKTVSQHLTDMDNPMFPFMLQPWVVDELNKSQELANDFQMAYNTFKAQYV